MNGAFTTASGTVTPIDTGSSAGTEIVQLHTPGLGDNTYVRQARSVRSTGLRSLCVEWWRSRG